MSTRPRREPTSTSNFGAGRRESHDASAFYDRFTPPILSDDEEIKALPESVRDRVYCGDAREMTHIPDNSIALVVTSPPYFAGKEYEEALGEGDVPGDYLEFLQMLYEVFTECVRVLEPGGRIAVNVANLGRKPYRSLSADVIQLLQDELHLLLRGEIIWVKAKGATGSTAWGSFQSPSNPVLRDLTERVVIASKGRFGRAVPRRLRAERELPSEITIFKDEFMEATTDVWEIPPESARRVGHPAPFPAALPQRIIDLYTYRDDVVLDPFMGSGSTAVAAIRTDRHFVGYDLDHRYVSIAEERIDAERARLARNEARRRSRTVSLPAVPRSDDPDEDFQSRAVREGQKAHEIAHALLRDCGFTDIEENVKRGPVEVNFEATDQAGDRWYFDVSGAFTSSRPGLRRTDTLWKALGKASTLSVMGDAGGTARRLVFLTTDLPTPGSVGSQALHEHRGTTFFDAVEMLSPEGHQRLRTYAEGGVAAPEGDLLEPEDVDGDE